MRLFRAALLAASLLPTPALAGGLGLSATGGWHMERVYYYQENALGEFEQQDPVGQVIPNGGGGLEIVLGDKDNKVLGNFRLYYLVDLPQSAPADPSDYTFNIRSDARHIGVIDAGISFGFVGDPGGLQATVVGYMGSGFFTTDQTEFVHAMAGLGGTWMLDRHVQLSAQLTGGARYKKNVYPINDAAISVRYLFD